MPGTSLALNYCCHLRNEQYLEILTYIFILIYIFPFSSFHSTRMNFHHIDSEKVCGTSKPLKKCFEDYEESKEYMKHLGHRKCNLKKQGVHGNLTHLIIPRNRFFGGSSMKYRTKCYSLFFLCSFSFFFLSSSSIISRQN